MATLDIRLFGDPVLRQRAHPVTSFDDQLRGLTTDMRDTMRAAGGVGLAANQVGVLQRLFTWRILDEEEVETATGTVVNPDVEDTSAEIQVDDEGCLSFPGLFYPVERPLWARVGFQDLTGDKHVEEVAGLKARVFLHEIDHLNGILLIDHLALHDRREAMRRMRQQRLRDEHETAPDGQLLRGLGGRKV